MKNKKIVSLLLAACLSLSAMTVNAWAENGGENKDETPVPVVQEVEGEDKKDQETKPEEPKTEETGEGEDKKDQETNEGENKETNKDENKAGEGEDKKTEETKPAETNETKPADPPVAATYGTDVVASERKLETLVTYHIQMVNKDGKPIANTTFEVRGPVGRDLTGLAGENATGSDENGWLDLTVVDPFMAGSVIGNAANDFYLKAPDGTWYWANLGPEGVYVLYVYIGSNPRPWFDYDGKDENNNYKNFKRVTLKPEKPEPPTPPTPEEPELGKKTFAVYYRYDNETPSPQHSPRDDEEYGPSGDSKSNFTLTVDMDKLKEKHPNGIKYDANDRVTEWYITPDSCSIDAKTWWENVLACATEKDNLPENSKATA